MSAVVWTWIESPLGRVAVACGDRGVERVGIGPGASRVMGRGWRLDPHLANDTTRQLTDFLRGDRREFDLPVTPVTTIEGSPFQRSVWEALREIPYGETASYGEIARRVDAPGAARAVGIACNRNPLPIIVPCHRVVGADGRLVGFGGGLPLKRALLEMEAEVSGKAVPSLFSA
jgi:methylated-DNA-[protein]-cysteine S-methyltransferase